MVLVELTPAEVDRHQRAISKLRAQLFRRYSPQEFWIVKGSESVTPATADTAWMAGRGEYRVFRYGGLGYKVNCGEPAGYSRIAIHHKNKDVFGFRLISAQGATVTADDVRFATIDQQIHECITRYRASEARYRAHVVAKARESTPPRNR